MNQPLKNFNFLILMKGTPTGIQVPLKSKQMVGL
jgi:hypothetical protein